MSISPIGGATPLAGLSGTPESREPVGAPDHDGDADDAGTQATAATSPKPGRTIDVSA